VTGRAQDGLLFLARLLLAAALLPTGIARALNVSGFAVTLAATGLPSPNAVATAAVIVQVFGPIALILGVLPRISGLALAAFAGVMAVLLHPFWQFVGPSAVAERTLLLADFGLAGGFLIYAMAGPGRSLRFRTPPPRATRSRRTRRRRACDPRPRRRPPG
jgi:putative oxidoreductase